jgi:hypothetical protein
MRSDGDLRDQQERAAEDGGEPPHLPGQHPMDLESQVHVLDLLARCDHGWVAGLEPSSSGLLHPQGKAVNESDASHGARLARPACAGAEAPYRHRGISWRPRKTCTPESSKAVAPIHGCTARARGS